MFFECLFFVSFSVSFQVAKVTPEAPKMRSKITKKSSKVRVRILIKKRYRKSVFLGSLGPSRLRLPCRREHDFEKISRSKKVAEK